MFTLLALFLMMVVADVCVRWSMLKDISASQVLVFSGSAVLELTVLFILISALTKEKILVKKMGLKLWLLVIGLIYSFGIFSSWSFFSYFKTLPGVFAFSYLFSEPADFINLMGSGVKWYKVAAILGVGTAWAFAAYSVVHKRAKVDSRRMSRWQQYGVGILLLSLVAILNNNTRISPGVALPLTDAIFSFKTAVVRQSEGKESWVRLQRRIAGELPSKLLSESKFVPSKFNVVLIINESLRRQNLGFYGYRSEASPGGLNGGEPNGDTTPKLGRLLTSDTYRSVFFERALANATMTSVSVPSVLTGISPAQGFDTMHRSYVIYEQVKRLDRVKTALISAHSYVTGNYRAFMASEALDFLWYRETDNLPAYNNVGADDRYVPEQFKKFLNTVGPEEKFFAVLHTNGTHYPYMVPDEYKSAAAENSVGAYDDSIRYLDSNLAKVLEELTARGLRENTVVILTADHGESFGEDGSTGHFGKFTLYNSNVPLVVAIPEKLVAAVGAEKANTLRANQTALVSNADIFPTLLDLYSIPYNPESYPGQSLFTPIPPERPVVLYNLVDTGVKKSYLGVFKGEEGLVITRDETTSKISASLHNFEADPRAIKDLFPGESQDKRHHWLTLIERFPLVASYGEALK